LDGQNIAMMEISANNLSQIFLQPLSALVSESVLALSYPDLPKMKQHQQFTEQAAHT
jgi:hypothetical protein